jgi:microcystin-dependent protein
MSEPFLGEIRRYPYSNIPNAWAECNGQLLPISENRALYQLLETNYGGDGITTFALPNLQGLTPVGGATLGQTGGGTGPSQSYLPLVFAIATIGIHPT